MVSYQELLRQEAEKRKWNKNETRIFDSWRQSVSRAEGFTGNPALLQRGGPAQGKYQIEPLPSEQYPDSSGHNKVVKNRIINFLKRHGRSLEDLPDADVRELSKDNPDFSKLSEDTQDIGFLADKTYEPKAPLDKLVKGEINFKDLWIQSHWKGKESKKAAKEKYWDDKVGITTVADLSNKSPSWLKPLQTEEGQRPSMGLAMGPSEGGLFSLLGSLYRDYQEKQKTADLNDWEEPGAFKMPPSFAQEQELSNVMAGVGDTTPVDTTVYPTQQPTQPFYGRDYSPPQTKIYYDQPAPQKQYATMEELLMDKGLMNPLMRR